MKPHREVPSPNHGPRPSGSVIDMLILHYTGMPDAAGALERLCDPESRVSAHYLVDRDGTVTALVAEERRAWHAGVASWCGATDINDRSIGIELVNPGHRWGYLPFPPEQMSVLAELCRGIVSRHAIDPGAFSATPTSRPPARATPVNSSTGAVSHSPASAGGRTRTRFPATGARFRVRGVARRAAPYRLRLPG